MFWNFSNLESGVKAVKPRGFFFLTPFFLFFTVGGVLELILLAN